MKIKILLSCSLFAALVFTACSNDNGTSSSPDSSSSIEEISSSSAEDFSSSSAAVEPPPQTDDSVALMILDFDVQVEAGTARLEGSIKIDKAKDPSATFIDTVEFRTSPGGPVVLTSRGIPKQQSTIDLQADLGARIDLTADFACGEYTVYVTGRVDGRPLTDSATFTKDASFCPSSSSVESSSSAAPKNLSSWTETLAAQGRSGNHGIDLDTKEAYGDISAIAANASKVDILFGVEGQSLAYLSTPKGAGTGYSSVLAASGGYTGKIYGPYDGPTGRDPQTSDDLIFDVRDSADNISAYYNNYYVVTTDQYNPDTKAGLFLIRVDGQFLSSGATTTTPVTIWSVVQ